MAKATTLRASQLLLRIGDGASPEVFSAPCGFTSKNFRIGAQTNDTNVPDCDDEDAPSWLERDTVSKDWGFDASGVHAEESVALLEGVVGERRNMQVALGSREYTGVGIITELTRGAERGGRITINMTVVGDGELVAAT